MSKETKVATKEEQAPDLFKGLPALPVAVEAEEEIAREALQANVNRIAAVDPAAVEKTMRALTQAMTSLREIAIKTTHAYDWTLYKDADGRVVGVPRDSAAVVFRKWFGISTFNYRPIRDGIPEPRISKETVDRDGKVETIEVAEMWGDGYCARTGERIESVYFAVRNEPDEFTGRKQKGTKTSTVQDLKASCRTGLDAKIIRILSGLRKVPEDVLKGLGVDVVKSHRGRGFGTSAERQAGKVAKEGVPELAEKLKDEILRKVGGDVGEARKLLKEITANPEKKFFGFDSFDRFTEGWQIENAVKRLRTHPVYGDGPPEDEPGSRG